MNIRVLRPYLFSLLKLPRVRMKECKEAAENGGEMKIGSVALPVDIEKTTISHRKGRDRRDL